MTYPFAMTQTKAPMSGLAELEAIAEQTIAQAKRLEKVTAERDMVIRALQAASQQMRRLIAEVEALKLERAS